MSSTIVESLPGGLTIASGGTRTAVKLDRPWQQDITVDPSKCPFCTKPQTVEHSIGGWRVLQNTNTPFDSHRLIIPNACWPKEELRVLGGIDRIFDALLIGFMIARQSEPQKHLYLGAHIGALGGQNIPHLHWHCLTPIYRDQSQDPLAVLAGDALRRSTSRQIHEASNNPARLIMEHEEVRVVAGGHRAGQCFFTFNEESPFPLSTAKMRDLAWVIDATVKLYADRFRSPQGLPPDYMAGIHIGEDGEFLYGYYLPILNQPGYTEYFALLEGTAWIIPWPHEETVKHLQGGNS